MCPGYSIPPQGAVKSVQEVNTTFTTTGTGTETIYEVSLSTTVNPDKSVFIPTGHGAGAIMYADGVQSGVNNHGIAIKSDGTALQVYTRDAYAGTYRLIGKVIEYY